MGLVHIDTAIADYLNAAADRLDAEPTSNVSDIIRDVTCRPRWYTHVYNSFIRTSGVDPLTYQYSHGSALTAYRMRELADSLGREAQ